MSVCMSLCCNGFQTATSKLVAEKPQNRQIILICAIIMSATIALLLTIIMYSNANYISICILSESRCTELVKALSFSILPAAIHSCINGYYYGLKKAAVPAATQLIEQTARIGTCYLIYSILSDGGSCFKPVYSIYGIVAGEASATVFSVITIKKDFSYFKISVKSLKTTAYGMAALFIPLSLNYILTSFSSSVENARRFERKRIFGGQGFCPDHPFLRSPWRRQRLRRSNRGLSGNPARPAHDPSDYGHETDTQRDQNQHEYKQADQHHFEHTLFPVNATQQFHQRGTPEVPSPPMSTQQARTASLAFFLRP